MSRTFLHRVAVWAGPLLLAACLAPSHLPVDDGSARGPTPGLLPLSEVLGQTGPGLLTELASQDFSGRVNALNARAQQLRRPLIAPADRARMMAMLARHRGGGAAPR